MSLSTESYSDFVNHVEAMCSESFTTNELTRLQKNANFAARRAYNASVWWERFLVVSEPRSVERGDIAFTEDAYYLYGAGTAGSNNLYKRNGSANGNARYSKYGANDSILWDLEYDGSANWEVLTGSGNTLTENTVYYTVANTDSTPPLSGWSVSNGVSPAPLLVDVSDIETVLLVNQYDLISDSSAYCPVGFHSTARGITLHRDDLDIAYVTYRKPLTEKYGDGSGGTTTSIPSEWFYFMAAYCARLQQISMRQSNDSPYVATGSREVEESLSDALMKLEEQNTSNSIAKRIQTHLQYNTQL